MDAVRVIKSNAECSNTRTWAGDTWRINTDSARGDNVEVAMGGNSVQE